MANVSTHASRARRVPASPVRPRAHLLTLSTRGRIPLLVVDPRAGSVVDRHVRSLHRPEAPLLAWSVTADQVLVLVGPSPTSRIARMAHRLRDHTAFLLTRLGHARPWTLEVPVLPIRPHHDLAALVEYVLAAPVRAGLTEGWSEWPWSGSGQWPDVDPAFLTRHASDRLWLDAVTACLSPRSRAPADRTTGAIRRRRVAGRRVEPAG